jgi:amino acid transporter
MPGLTRKLGLFEAVGVSLSMIAPTMAVAFNTSLVAQAAGPATPLAFAVGTVMIALVGLSFVFFSRRVASAGSALAYVGHAFGRRWGFIAGWMMLLSYLTFTGATTALIGNFLDAAATDFGLQLPRLWLLTSTVGTILCIYCVSRDIKLAARLMLLLEGLSIVAIVLLSTVILVTISRTTGLSLQPFRPAAAFSGWAGVGYGLVFTILSFAGFEGAATLGEEALSPRRDIPIAIAGTVILAGAFFVFVSYAEVMGYGLDQMKALGASNAPLNTLSLKFISKDFAIAVDLAAAISAFSAAMGALSAAARMMFALGRAGLNTQMSEVDGSSGSPKRAVMLCGTIALLGLVAWAPFVGATNYYDYMGTIGTLSLIVVYMGVTGAVLTTSWPAKHVLAVLLGLAGTVVLIWPLYNSIYPVPAFPNNLWPYAVLAWIVIGAAFLVARPALSRTLTPELARSLD